MHTEGMSDDESLVVLTRSQNLWFASWKGQKIVMCAKSRAILHMYIVKEEKILGFLFIKTLVVIASITP